MGGLVNPQDEAQEAAKEVLGPDWHGAGTAPLFSKATGERLAAMLEGAENPVEYGNALAKSMGTLAPAGMAQLMGNSAAETNVMLSCLKPADGKLVADFRKDPENRKRADTLLGMGLLGDGVSKKDYDEKLASAMGPLMRTFSQGGDARAALAIYNTARDMGLALMLSAPGLSMDEAVARVLKSIQEDNYHIAEGNSGRTFRIPKAVIEDGLDPDAIETAASRLLGTIALRDLDLSVLPQYGLKGQGKAFRSLIRDEGYWQTAPDESGAILMLAGHAVLGSDRLPYKRTWAQILEARGGEPMPNMMEWRNAGGVKPEPPPDPDRLEYPEPPRPADPLRERFRANAMNAAQNFNRK